MPLSVQYPSTVGGSDLYNALDWTGFAQRNQQFQQAMLNEEQNRRAQLQDILFNDQMNPLKVDHQRLVNETKQADLPRVKADAWQATDKQRILEEIDKKDPLSRVQAAYTASEAERAKNRRSQVTDEIYTGMVNPNPEIAAQAKARYQQSPEYLKFSEGNASKEGIAEGRNATAIEVARINAEARRKQAVSWVDAVHSGKLTYQNAAVLFNNLAMQETDEAKKQAWATAASKYQLAAQLQAQAGGQAKPTVDLPGLTQGKVPVVNGGPPGTNLGAAPAPQQPAQSPNVQAAVTKAFGSYDPNKYEYRIGPDGVPQRRLKQQGN